MGGLIAMDMEATSYRLSPDLYAITGIPLNATRTSGLRIFQGVLLVLAASAQFRLRWVCQRELERTVRGTYAVQK